MLKSVKKLKKFWSGKKKRRKKQYHIHEADYHSPPPPPPPPPPPASHCCCCSYSAAPTQPSAPPLPPWLQYEQSSNEAVCTSELLQPLPELAHPGETEFPSPEIVAETNPIYYTLPANTASSSYQQYMVPNPVFGVPLGQTPRRESSAGFFGCVVSFGLNLIRFFCPCFHIRQVA